MKRLFPLFLLLITMFLFAACEQETILSIDQTSISIPVSGGSATLQLTANKAWSAKSDQSWCRVSPSTGENASGTRITITCDANQGYDERKGTVTFTCEEKMVSVSVSQSNASGLFVTTDTYELSNEKHTLTVEVKANVEYEVTSEVDWIKYTGTKGLATSQIILEIAENESYDSREGKVLVKQKNGSLSGTITIRQDRTMALFVTPSEFNLSNESQTIEVEVKYNVDFTTVVPEACQDWISIAETKVLSSITYSIFISKNETFEKREGSITFKQKDGSLSGTVAIRQEPGELPPAFAVDIREDTGKDELLFLMESGAYFLYKQTKESDILYFNSSIDNELSEGLFFTENKMDNSLSLSCRGDRTIFFQIAEDTYNVAVTQSDGTTHYYYGLIVGDGSLNRSSNIQTKMTGEDWWHLTKSGIYRLGYYLYNVLLTPTNVVEIELFEIYKSNWFNIQEYIDEDKVKYVENLVSFSNKILSFIDPGSGGPVITDFITSLGKMSDEELDKVGKEKEVVKPELGDEWNFKIQPSVLACPNVTRDYVVKVSSKAMWDLDKSGLDYRWCNVRRSGDDLIVGIRQFESNLLQGHYQCLVKVIQYGETETYHVQPATLTIELHSVVFRPYVSELVFDEKGGQQTVAIEMSSDVVYWDWSDKPDWCTLSKLNGGKSLKVVVSSSNEKRDGLIWLYAWTPNDERVAVQLKIIQTTRVPVESIQLQSDRLTFWELGARDELRYTILPEEATDMSVTWTTSDPSVATVDENGIVTAVNYGTAIITVRTNDGQYEDTCTVVVLTQKEGELRDKLYKFYHDTDGPNWVNNDNWCSDKPLDTWFGLNYKDGILQIVLRDNGLKGNGNLADIAELDFVDVSSFNYSVEKSNSNQLESLNLKGCSSLRQLWCVNNLITDVMLEGCSNLEILNCSYNNIESIDFYECPSLTEICVSNNSFSELDIRGLIKLTKLECEHNNLKQLNLSDKDNLTFLACGANQLKELSVSGFKQLTGLSCGGNLFENLDLSGCVSLRSLSLYERNKGNKLKTLNISGTALRGEQDIQIYDGMMVDLETLIASNCPYLENTSFIKDWNNVKVIDISNCPHINKIGGEMPNLEYLNVSRCVNLQIVNCNDCNLHYLGLDGCESLQELYCDNNNISELNLKDCNNLQFLSCNRNNIHDLYLKGKTNLKQVFCSNNQLSQLDVSGSILLEWLHCYNNGIETINFDGCSSLKRALCDNNKITELTLSNLPALRDMSWQDNNISSIYINNCNSLTSLGGLSYTNPFLKSLKISQCNALVFIDINIFGYGDDIDEYPNIKEISITDCKGLHNFRCGTSNNLESLCISGCETMTRMTLHCPSLRQGLKLTGCDALEDVYIVGTELSQINLSGIKALNYATILGNTLLESLDLSDCSQLTNVDCYRDDVLKHINVQGCKSLKRLECTECCLSELDVSGCEALEYIDCYHNKIANIDLTGCLSLKTLGCSYNQLTSLTLPKKDGSISVGCSNNRIIQKITPEFYDTFYSSGSHDALYTYWDEWDAIAQQYIKKYKKNDYGWYYEGEPEKGCHCR